MLHLSPGKVVLDVENVTMHSAQHKKDAVRNVSFQVHAGEIVCLAGIEGNGQTEFVLSLIHIFYRHLRGPAHQRDGQRHGYAFHRHLFL